MENNTLRILMVDDHPMIIEGYQHTLLANKKPNQTLDIDIATDCDSALDAIKKSRSMGKPYNIYFFDISIPASQDGIYKSGEDLAKYIKQVQPEAKVVILTMFNEVYRIHSIIRSINPEGFLIKSDLTSSELASAFDAIQNNPPFYTGTITNVIKRSIFNPIEVDEINHKMLHFLSLGVKTKDLVGHLGITLSAIEKRKKNLKDLFIVDDGKDETLIAIAKDKGYI
ncbi:DNA-binding response regulator [Olleya aquimaris]|uniref:Response regulator transcription factor n=1 Tax=Olleya sediminilitoris TaxID=2795739 RepID=A0ABS1WM81_9FLAO|nr:MULTISPECIES: response regulator [Olleya]AXO80446.1 DNA-binding response regulator [Olleya aquimaris]MBL7560229.1 response regulator transcription factor [Olleya sediminilitoris]